MSIKPLTDSIRYGWRTLSSRKIYFALMIVVPLAATFFFLNLMDNGLPLKVPTAVVDLDRSSMSRQLVRSLSASQMLDLSERDESFYSAMQKVRSRKVMGFFYIPENFQADALGGRTPTISYYCNLA